MDGFSTSFDGIFGLAFDQLSKISKALRDAGVPGTTDANYIDDLPADIPKLFSIYLSGHHDGDFGEFVVGGIDQSRVIGDFTYLNVVEELWWTLDLQGATVSLVDSTGNKVVDKMPISSPDTPYVIVDSGTPGIVLQDDIANSLVETLRQMDCQNMPTLTVSIGGNDFDVAPEYYVYQNGDGTCDPLIFPGGFEESILGAAFMQNYYTVFDKVNKRVGFAKANHNPSSPTTTSTTPVPTTTSTPVSSSTSSSVPVSQSSSTLYTPTETTTIVSSSSTSSSSTIYIPTQTTTSTTVSSSTGSVSTQTSTSVVSSSSSSSSVYIQTSTTVTVPSTIASGSTTSASQYSPTNTVSSTSTVSSVSQGTTACTSSTFTLSSSSTNQYSTVPTTTSYSPISPPPVYSTSSSSTNQYSTVPIPTTYAPVSPPPVSTSTTKIVSTSVATTYTAGKNITTNTNSNILYSGAERVVSESIVAVVSVVFAFVGLFAI
ncbi:hypothetical protein HDU76_003662 [Blyttiomyces sp. JEL0837]|nr:hypothetical protein HDU76_003662 [Blyttiomyces sp. JEL0837]